MDLQEIINQLTKLVKKETPVIKSVEQEERKALFVVLEPSVVDLHGDIYDAKEIEKACINFNKHCQKANFFHRVELQEAEIIQSYISPTDFVLETPTGTQTVAKGTWIQEWRFPEGEIGNMLWEGVKSGEFNGVSIGARCEYEELQ